jgi:hypothetical protein
MAAATPEQTLFQDQNVFISTTRLIVNGVTYPLSNVSSVRLLRRGPNYIGAVIFTLLGLIFAASALGGGGAGAGTFGLIMLAVGIGMFVLLKATYTMLIGSAGGEKAALTSKNGPYMQGVVEHINQAIVARG